MWMRSTKMYVDVRCSPLDAARALVTRYLWIPPERAIGTASSRQDKADRCSKITLQKELPISNRYWCFSEMWFTSTSVMLNRCTAACEWNKNCSTVVTCNYNTAFLLVINNCMIQISIEKDGNSYFSTLEITNVAVEDGGKYKVTAKNELGESNATINLNFDSNLDYYWLLFVALFILP